MDSRVRDLASSLNSLFRSITGVELRLVSPDDWPKTPDDPTRLHRPYGWLPVFEDDGVLVQYACPLLIAQQTAHLSDEDFESYLRALKWQMSMHVTLRAIPIERRARLVDDLFYETAPETLSLISDVQMRALSGNRR